MATKGFLSSTIEKLSPEQANKELEKLYKEVQLHNKLYFQEDSPKIPDSEYDALVERIRHIEKLFPKIKISQNLLGKVGF